MEGAAGHSRLVVGYGSGIFAHTHAADIQALTHHSRLDKFEGCNYLIDNDIRKEIEQKNHSKE